MKTRLFLAFALLVLPLQACVGPIPPWNVSDVCLGSEPDINGVVARGPLWSGKQTFEAHDWILVMLTSASEREADLAA